mgnify:CR=1 FL=1
MSNSFKEKINKLSSISSIIKNHNLSANKKLGQNFLLDLNLTNKIAKSGGNLKNIDIIEIGPGPGGLTRSLLYNNAKRVIAIEKDKRFIKALDSLRNISNKKLILLNDDALKIKLIDIINKHKISKAFIIANLPYSIGTKLLLNWIPMPKEIKQMTLMFQKEFAERIIAKPGSKKYGRISVIIGLLTDAKIIMNISSKAFTPQPKINSAIIKFTPKPNKKILFKVEILEEITRVLFNQKRKKIKSKLKYFGEPEFLCQKTGIDPSIRAEEIPIENYEKLAIEISNSQHQLNE